MEYQVYVSYIVVGLIWVAIFILAVVMYFLLPPEIYYWNKVFDKCNKTTAKHIYVIRFIFGKYKNTFQLSKTTLTIEIWDKKKVIVALEITPKQLEAFIADCPKTTLRTVRFLLYRKEPLVNISFVVVNHNSKGTINVTNIEIQDTKEKMANVVYVGMAVAQLSKGTANLTQRFGAAQKEQRFVEPELKPTVSLTALEFIVFFFLVINLILLSTIYLIPCPEETLCKDYKEGFISSLFAGLSASFIAAVVLTLSCCLHRYVIKQLLVKGTKFCSFVRYMFLFLALILGAVSGIVTAFMAAENRRFPKENKDEDFFHELFWMFGVGIALIVFFLLWISMLAVIAYLIGFFSEPEEMKVDFMTAEDKTMRTETDDSDGSVYMNQLIKGNTKVKSISQYGGLSLKDKRPVTPTQRTKQEPLPSEDTKATKRTASNESTGSGYYKQLMKQHGKVKSVSQYKG